MTAVFPEPYKVPSMAAPSGVLNVMVRGAGVGAGGSGEGVGVEAGAAHAVSKWIRIRVKEMWRMIREYSRLNKKLPPPMVGYQDLLWWSGSAI